MAKVKNISGEDRTVPALGDRLVLDGQTVDVEADAVYGYTCQTATWEPVDAEAKRAHKKGAEESRAESISNLPAGEALAVYTDFVKES